FQGNLRHLSSNCLAREKVLYQGYAIATVAATSPHVAEEALKLIKVDYEPLPPALDVVKAMEDGTPLLRTDLRTQSLASEKAMAKRGSRPISPNIISSSWSIRTRASPRPRSSSSASSAQRWCIRATSSRTMRRHSSTPTGR